MKIETTAYAVLIWGKAVPERVFLGHSDDPVLPQIYGKRKDAVAYKKGCIEAGLKNVKVVRVAVSYEFELPKEIQ